MSACIIMLVPLQD